MKLSLLSAPANLAALIGVTAFASSASAIDFKTEIEPILRDRCFKCHGGPRPKGKLSFDKTEKLSERIGGEDAVIIPGDPAASLMVKKASLPRNDTDAMPPQGRGDPMNLQELAIVKKWIEEGASFEEGGATPNENGPADGVMKADETVYDWTNLDGNTLQAKFISTDGTNVTLAKPDGSEFTYPLEKLSAESQAQATNLGGQ